MAIRSFRHKGLKAFFEMDRAIAAFDPAACERAARGVENEALDGSPGVGQCRSAARDRRVGERLAALRPGVSARSATAPDRR